MSVDSDRMRILIIDDNPSLVNIFKKILEIKGFSVTSENTFKKGLQNLKKNKFQVAYVDAPLDGYDDNQILTLLFENKIFQKTSVFLFSSVDFDASELLRWKNKGLYSYLKKPIERSKIIQELEVLRSNFKIDSSPELSDAATEDEEEPTPEQLEKLTLLEKQIHDLETNQTIKPKSIPGKLLLQNVIDGLRSSTVHSTSKLYKSNVSSSKNVKETIEKEIQKTLSDISILKKEIKQLDDDYDASSIISNTKRKLKKKAATATTDTPTKRKLKKN